jgi:hypothetical protein
MPRPYDFVDMFWSSDGDYEVDERGDLQDTSYDVLRSIHQQIQTRIMSDKGDWQYQKRIGAGLSNFVGDPNTAETGRALQNAITSALLQNGLINMEDLKVKIAPISPTHIAFQVTLNYLPTRENATSLPVTLNFMYDYADTQVYPFSNRYSVK